MSNYTKYLKDREKRWAEFEQREDWMKQGLITPEEAIEADFDNELLEILVKDRQFQESEMLWDGQEGGVYESNS